MQGLRDAGINVFRNLGIYEKGIDGFGDIGIQGIRDLGSKGF